MSFCSKKTAMVINILILVFLHTQVHSSQVGNVHTDLTLYGDTDGETLSCNFADCLYFINLRETIHLTYLQKQQIAQRREFLRAVRGRLVDAGSKSLKYDDRIVEITPEQEAKILAVYGNYFGARNQLPVDGNPMQKREVDICPRVQSWDDLVLRLTSDDNLIEVVQLDDDNKQWILEETCSQSTCSFVTQCACGTWTRLVRALVISFDQTVISEKYIKVYCCIAKKISTP